MRLINIFMWIYRKHYMIYSGGIWLNAHYIVYYVTYRKSVYKEGIHLTALKNLCNKSHVQTKSMYQYFLA